MVNDPISDMLIKIKNAGMTGLKGTSVSYSNLKFEIANVLLKEGFIKSFSVKGKKVRKHIEIEIAYRESGIPRIEDVVRISKLSRRVYAGVRDLKPVKQGHGIAVLSTPKGILTGAEAKRQKVGGEVLFKIW